MKVYDSGKIRNVVFAGHASSGKTSMAEACLFNAGAINRKGTVEDKNTISDFHELEHERQNSVFAAPLAYEYKNIKINLIDTPGFDDYIGEMASSLRIADTTMIFLNAQNGLEVGTENAWQLAENYNKPVCFFVNKLDVEQADYDKSVQELKDRWGGSCTVVQYPVGKGTAIESVIDIIKMKMFTSKAGDKEATVSDIPDSEKDKATEMRTEFIESIAESDEELMNKYFEEGDLSEEDLANGMKKAILDRQIFPILCGVSKNNVGTASLNDFILNVLPSPLDMPAEKTEGDQEVSCDSAAAKSLIVFKMTSVENLGDMTFFRLMSGKVGSGMDFVNAGTNTSERFGQLFIVNGKKREEISEVYAGDIAATVKLKNTKINDTLHEKGKEVIFKKIDYPNPKVRTAVEPVTKGEEEKVGMSLNALHQEDPSLVVEHSKELRQIILYAQGELHLAVAKWRLEHRYGVKVQFVEPRVPYRETIQKGVKSMYRHKKQSGGAGQFAEVHMLVEPYVEGAPDPGDLSIRGRDLHDLSWGGKLEYVNCIVGGVIDQRFLPAILKGIMEKMEIGPLTGSYVRDIKVYVYDGKMHPVDSNEAAFKMAGTMAFKDAFTKAAPKILEPIYDVEIKVPEEFVGDVMSDLPSRRGVIQGIEAEGRYQLIKARMPLAELDKYSTALRSMTQARASYTQTYAEYDTVPSNVQQELIDAYQKSQEED